MIRIQLSIGHRLFLVSLVLLVGLHAVASASGPVDGNSVSSTSLLHNEISSAPALTEEKSLPQSKKCWLWNDGKDCLKDVQAPDDEIAEGPEEEKEKHSGADENGIFVPRVSSKPAPADLFMSEFIRRTVMRKLVYMVPNQPGVLVLPLLGEVEIEPNQKFPPNGTVNIMVTLHGSRMRVAIEISKYFDFKMSFTVPKSFSERTIATVSSQFFFSHAYSFPFSHHFFLACLLSLSRSSIGESSSLLPDMIQIFFLLLSEKKEKCP